MTKAQLEWYVIIGNILAVLLSLLTHNLSIYISIAGLVNGPYIGLLICERIDKKKKK